jgi:hypothetical protein
MPPQRKSLLAVEYQSLAQSRRTPATGRKYSLANGRFRATDSHGPLRGDQFQEPTDAHRPISADPTGAVAMTAFQVEGTFASSIWPPSRFTGPTMVQACRRADAPTTNI